jgi:hypothetical protein
LVAAIDLHNLLVKQEDESLSAAAAVENN